MSKKSSKKSLQAAKKPTWLLPAAIGGAVLAFVSLALLTLSNRQPAYTPEVTGGPRAEIDQREVEHGDVRFETLVESVYRVRNIGDRPLRILNEPWVEVIEGC
jgi:hypothetical protein